MSEALRRYRLLEALLWYTRWRNEESESPEEDAILDEMDEAWLQLDPDEQGMLRAEAPRCWPMDPSCRPPLLSYVNTAAPSSWTYDDFTSPEEAILETDAA